LKGWNLRALRNETHTRASISNTCPKLHMNQLNLRNTNWLEAQDLGEELLIGLEEFREYSSIYQRTAEQSCQHVTWFFLGNATDCLDRWCLRATSHTRLRASDHSTSSTLIGGKGGAGLSSSFTLRLRDQQCMWMQDGCKVCMDFYMASNGSCFMVTWIIFKDRLLEVGLVQNQEIMALQTLTTFGLFYFIMCEDPHE
jgi:hypothetical protein